MRASIVSLLAVFTAHTGATLADEDATTSSLRQNAVQDNRAKRLDPIIFEQNSTTFTTTTTWVTTTVTPVFVDYSAWPPVPRNGTHSPCSTSTIYFTIEGSSKSFTNASTTGLNPASATKSVIHSHPNTSSAFPTDDIPVRPGIVHTKRPPPLVPSSQSDSTTILTYSRPPNPLVSMTSLPTATTSLPTAPSSANSSSICRRPFHHTNYTSTGPWYGVNVVNSRPGSNQHSLGPKRDTSDWEAAFKIIKNLLPHINAVRLYSTMDWNGTSPEWLYLENALPAAKKYGLKILAGVWAGGLGSDQQARFSAERDALSNALRLHGCDDIVAVSVGNEDLNDINEMTSLTAAQVAMTKQQTVDLLVRQMNETRTVLDQFGCCEVPVTHTDTWNEIFNDTAASPWVRQLIQACDSSIIVNIFPYWQNTQLDQAYGYLTTQAAMVLNTTAKYGKDIWLGETGWPRQDQNQEALNVANPINHQQYFNEIGCQILSGNGSAFYYVDWDEDSPLLSPPRPAFGISRYDGSPLIDLSCRDFQPNAAVQETWPKFLGGKGVDAWQG